jgi:DNA-binding NtrC family response regulator
MTRVLVVHHDPDMADQEADSLRRYGYDPVECSGPNFWACPILAGQPCPAIDDVDVLLYDVYSASSDSQRLIEQIREIHPGAPLVVSGLGMDVEWLETQGIHGVTPVIGPATGERLAGAIELAISAAKTPTIAGL